MPRLDHNDTIVAVDFRQHPETGAIVGVRVIVRRRGELREEWIPDGEFTPALWTLAPLAIQMQRQLVGLAWMALDATSDAT